MSNGVQLEWPQADVNAMFRSMEYARRYLNADAGRAMKQAVAYLLRSVAASTKVAPKFREINERPGFVTKRSDLRAYGVTGWFGKPRRESTRLVYSRDYATAKRRHATIGNRGLAKLTWKWAARLVNSKIESAKFSTLGAAITNKIAAQNVEGKSNYKGEDVFAEIHNSLPYIKAAMTSDVNTAMERAARGMMKSIDKQLVRRMKLGKLST